MTGVSKLVSIALVSIALAEPVLAFEVRPNPNLTSGSVRIDGRSLYARR
jgi:hypothetical protein